MVGAGNFNPRTQEGEAGGSLCVPGQSGLQELVPGQAPKIQRNPVSKNKKQTKKLKKIKTGQCGKRIEDRGETRIPF